MKPIELALPQLKQLASDIAVLKSCPAVPFPVAIRIHGNIFAIDQAITRIEGELQVIREQLREFNKTSTSPEKQLAYAAEAEAHGQEIINKKNAVSIDVIPRSLVEGIIIDGEKEVTTTNGIARFSYRDAYFNLVFFGIIEH
jgi:hypothetical protein